MRANSAVTGVAAFLAMTANAVQASELAEDVTAGTRHFRGPRWLKALAWAVLVLLAVEEARKVRERFEEVTDGV